MKHPSNWLVKVIFQGEKKNKTKINANHLKQESILNNKSLFTDINSII